MLAAGQGETKAAPVSSQPAASSPAPPRQISEDSGPASRYDMNGMSFKELMNAAREQTSSSSGPFQGQQAAAAEPAAAEEEAVVEPEPAAEPAAAEEVSEAAEAAPAADEGSYELPTDTAGLVAI